MNTKAKGHVISVVGRHLLVSDKGASEWVLGGDGEVSEVGDRRESEKDERPPTVLWRGAGQRRRLIMVGSPES